MAEKRVVRTERAPAPFRGAPYSQAIQLGDLVFVAGQVGLRPGESAIGGATIEEQTEQVCENLAAILEEARSSFANVLQTTVYLVDFADFEGMNSVYARYVDADAPPGRATVQVAALPAGARVEVAVIAHL